MLFLSSYTFFFFLQRVSVLKKIKRWRLKWCVCVCVWVPYLLFLCYTYFYVFFVFFFQNWCITPKARHLFFVFKEKNYNFFSKKQKRSCKQTLGHFFCFVFKCGKCWCRDALLRLTRADDIARLLLICDEPETSGKDMAVALTAGLTLRFDRSAQKGGSVSLSVSRLAVSFRSVWVCYRFSLVCANRCFLFELSLTHPPPPKIKSQHSPPFKEISTVSLPDCPAI